MVSVFHVYSLAATRSLTNDGAMTPMRYHMHQPQMTNVDEQTCMVGDQKNLEAGLALYDDMCALRVGG